MRVSDGVLSSAAGDRIMTTVLSSKAATAENKDDILRRKEGTSDLNGR